jgi:hypothetical protein
MKVEGRVDEFGLARLEGSVQPFKPTAFMDLAVLFRNVDMPTLSPYTITFAGRRVSSGKLSLDLRYKINEGQLAGENRVVLEKFTLGEKVQSEGALDLPLDLAVALLTDSDGKIDLTVPVAGNVDDPKFDYSAVIWQAVKIVLTKIVTAPFRALASLFGGGSGENYEAVAFDPGRAVLLPPEQEKLKQVADGLAKRPQIVLVAEGRTGPADLAALQQRDVALAVGALLGQPAPAPGTPLPSVNVTDAKTQRALEAIFVERNSSEALGKFVAETGKARGKEVERAKRRAGAGRPWQRRPCLLRGAAQAPERDGEGPRGGAHQARGRTRPCGDLAFDDRACFPVRAHRRARGQAGRNPGQAGTGSARRCRRGEVAS